MNTFFVYTLKAIYIICIDHNYDEIVCVRAIAVQNLWVFIGKQWNL